MHHNLHLGCTHNCAAASNRPNSYKTTTCQSLSSHAISGSTSRDSDRLVDIPTIEMKFIQVFAVGCSLVSASIAAAVQPITRDEIPARQFVPGGYIVELNDGEVLDDFLDDLRSTGLKVKGRRRLSTRFFHGLSFEVLESDEPDHVSLNIIRINPHH